MYYGIVIAREAPAGDPVLFRGPLADSARAAKEIGYDAVEIHARDAAEIARFREESDMRVAAVATGMAKRIDGLCFLDDSAEGRARAVERVNGFIDVAAELGAGVVIGSLRGKRASLAPAACDARFFECMDKLVNRAEKRGATLLLELINRYENDYLNNVEESLEYLRPLDSPRLKLNLDMFHMNIEEPDMRKAFLMCGARLGHLHAADNTRRYPGSGALNLSQILSYAREANYDGCVSLECLPLPTPNAAACAAIAQFRASAKLRD